MQRFRKTIGGIGTESKITKIVIPHLLRDLTFSNFSKRLRNKCAMTNNQLDCHASLAMTLPPQRGRSEVGDDYLVDCATRNNENGLNALIKIFIHPARGYNSFSHLSSGSFLFFTHFHPHPSLPLTKRYSIVLLGRVPSRGRGEYLRKKLFN